MERQMEYELETRPSDSKYLPPRQPLPPPHETVVLHWAEKGGGGGGLVIGTLNPKGEVPSRGRTWTSLQNRYGFLCFYNSRAENHASLRLE